MIRFTFSKSKTCKALLALLTLSAFAASAFSANWSENYDESVKKAREANKPLFILFTGSDWCPPCIQLERRVLASDTFSKFAEENLVLMKADFPRAPQNEAIKQQNLKLRDQFQVEGYPTVFVLNASSGDIYFKQSAFRGQTPQQYVNEIKSAIRD